jgi:CTP:molybdopterin cytidylyltransferase MocA
VIEIAVASPSVLVDLDTPEDYERLRKLWEIG